MILIGQHVSPFVRRVAIALELYGVTYEHRPWSVFGDVDCLRPSNPLLRVPALVLDDGRPLVESRLILDRLVPVARVMWPPDEPRQSEAQQIAALAMGVAEKRSRWFMSVAASGCAAPAACAR